MSTKLMDLINLIGRPADAALDAGKWQDLALCAETNPEAFFPGKGESVAEAKKICLRCEVREECLTYAIVNDERFGVWGGTSERERRKLQRIRRRR